MRDPYPLTWEIPAAATCVLVAVVVCGLQVGRAIANATVSGTWWWPHLANIVSSAPGLLAGDARAGLNLPAKTLVADPSLLYTWTAITEGVLVAAMVAAAVWLVRRWSPNVTPGMASRSEVQDVLGQERLYRVRSVIRPDLYPAATPKRWRRG